MSDEVDCARMWAWEHDKHRQDIRGAFNVGFAVGVVVTLVIGGLTKSWGFWRLRTFKTVSTR